jgi:peptidyl-tRNA hydrolase
MVNLKDPIVQYYVVRESLGMSVGKIGAQIAHASWMSANNYFTTMIGGGDVSNYQEWLKSGFRKVVLGAKDKIFYRLKKELICDVVVDAGLTEISLGSETILVFPPMRKSERPSLLSRLRLL